MTIKALLVAPVEQGSGETITCLQLGERLRERGDAVRFLASEFAAGFIRPSFGEQVVTLTAEGSANRAIWDRELASFRPDTVVFADYPMLFMRFGVAPLAHEEGWAAALSESDACMVTLDHFGYAQRAMRIFLGPPHLTFAYEEIEATPAGMQIMLPCPMHEPGARAWRRGEPFRHWQVPFTRPPEALQAARRRYLGGDSGFLIFHSVPQWAWRQAELAQLSFYRHLPSILDYYLRELPGPVTVVSVNNGRLLADRPGLSIRLVNLGPVAKEEFEDLLFGADLAITENGVSISMGKAVCGFQTCVLLKNSYNVLELTERLDGELRRLVLRMESERMGTVFPYEVYPSGMADLLEQIDLYRDNSITSGWRSLELFGGEETRLALRALLTEAGERETLRSRQQSYVAELRRLGDGSEVLHGLVARHGRVA